METTAVVLLTPVGVVVSPGQNIILAELCNQSTELGYLLVRTLPAADVPT